MMKLRKLLSLEVVLWEITKKGSDVDIAIIGENVNRSIIYNLEDCLNEVYPLPYFFDVILYNKITNENLINHIDNEGKILYTKK